MFGLNMDSQTRLPDSVPPPATHGRRTALRLVVAAVGVLLLAIVLFFALTISSGQKVVWLTSTDLNQSGRAGLFTGLKQKVARLVPQFVWRFWWNRPQINIDSSLLIIPAAAAEPTGLSAPAATNASGMRAWILSPAELNAFRQQLKTLSDVENLGVPPHVTIFDDRPTRWRVNKPVQVAGKVTPVGLAVDLMPKVVSGAIRLIVGATSTEAVTSAPDNVTTIRTNLAAACRVFLPNAGGLVVNCGTTNAAGGKSYWLIVSPTAVDARGNPIKL